MPIICIYLTLDFQVPKDIVSDCIWALRYHSLPSIESPLCDSNLLHKYLPLAFVEDIPEVYITPLVRLTANLALGPPECIDYLLNMDCLYDFIINCLKCKKKIVRQEICWFISNLFTGTEEQIFKFIQNCNGIMDIMVKIMQRSQ